MSKTRQRASRKPKRAPSKRRAAPPRSSSRASTTAASAAAERLYSINALSEELRIDRRTLKKHLSGIPPAKVEGKSKLYRLEDARRVIEGVGNAQDAFCDLRSEQIRQQTRESQARADLLEIERAEKRRDLIPLAEVQAIVREAFLPVRQRFLALPAELCNRVNPTDPQFAREGLQHWVDEALRLVREELPQPNTKAAAA